MEMVNIYDLTMLHHARVQGSRCQKTIRLKKGFPPELDFPNTELTGGEGIGSSKSSRAASVAETFDAIENCEMLGTLGGENSTQLRRGVEI